MELFSTIGVSELVKPLSFYRPDHPDHFILIFVFFIGFFLFFGHMWYNEISYLKYLSPSEPQRALVIRLLVGANCIDL